MGRPKSPVDRATMIVTRVSFLEVGGRVGRTMRTSAAYKGVMDLFLSVINPVPFSSSDRFPDRFVKTMHVSHANESGCELMID